jgi:dimethylglycine dehydrogenase
VIKAKEDYCLRHEIPFPHFNRLAGRPIKPSPLYETLKAKGAVFEEVYGFERPRWFAKDGVAQEDHYSFRRTVVDDMVAAEVKAVRERRRDHGCDRLHQGLVGGPGRLCAAGPADRQPDAAETGSHHADPHAQPPRADRAGNDHRAAWREDRFYLVCAAFFEQRLLDHLATFATGPMNDRPSLRFDAGARWR